MKIIPVIAKGKYGTDGDKVSWEEMTVLSTRGGRFRFQCGYVAEGDEARQTHGGPMVPGPWAYAFGLCSVIAANPEHGTGAERERRLAAGTEHEVEDGDRVVIAGVMYEVKPYRNAEFIKLVRVEES